MSNIMAAIASESIEQVGECSAENNKKYATSNEVHNEGVRDKFDENSVLHMAKNNLKKIEKYHDNAQTIVPRVSTSEEDPNMTIEKLRDISDKHHESKRISPPKNVQPVISGTEIQLVIDIFITSKI